MMSVQTKLNFEIIFSDNYVFFIDTHSMQIEVSDINDVLKS